MTRSLKGPPLRMYCFTYAWEPVPEAISVPDGSWDEFLLEPVTGAAVVYEDGWALLDTGFNPETVRDLEKRAAHFTVAVVPCLATGDPLLRQVEAAGLRWDELAFCGISHLHCDHSGGLPHLVDGPPVVIQAREHAFAMDEAGLDDAFFRSDYELPGVRWELIDGEVELAPGLRSVPTFGHTPGHQSFAVDLAAAGTVVLACDAADLKRNIDEPVRCGTTTHPELEPAADASIRLLHELDRTPRVQVWPGHDPAFWPTRLTPPAAYG